MGRAFFQSLEPAGAPVTVVDADPNATAPASSRVLKQTIEADFAGSNRGTRDIHLYATVVGPTTSVNGQVWIKDAAGLWLTFGAAITTLLGAIQTVADVPSGLDVFFQVTALNGGAGSAIPRLLAA